jgi:signal transduction histidine kinase
VKDNGVGFQAPGKVTDLAHNGHFGLIGMYERASLIEAKLEVQSAQQKGTIVIIRANTQPTA